MAEVKTTSSETKTNKIVTKKSERNASGGSKFKRGWDRFLVLLQELGKTLQFPIAVLPFAAILNRFGALGLQYATPDTAGYWISYIIQTPGGVVFDNLPLLFAIGVAFGLAKDHRGEVALVAALFYLVLAKFTAQGGLPEMIYGHILPFHAKDGSAYSSLFYVKTYDADGKTIIGGAYVLNIGVLGGIVAGCLSAFIYNRLKNIKLPQVLSFFGGRRFVPMVGLLFSMGVAFIFAIVWPWIQWVLMAMGQAVADPENPAVAIPGTALYAFLNRLLLPFGLHQILNTFFWFQLPINGEHIKIFSGTVLDGGTTQWVNGDINAFTAGISTSGLFQSGFFPVMMGGVPAICVAMILTAPKENRKNVAGFLGGVAGVSFVSGITEPVEFSFVFLAPILLFLHAVLSAIFVAVTTAMHIQIGFGFSAGFIDYCVSFAQSWGFSQHWGDVPGSEVYKTIGNPLWIWPLILVAAAAWFFTFYFIIKKMDIKTPGRDESGSLGAGASAFSQETDEEKSAKVGNGTKAEKGKKVDKYTVMAEKIVDTIGKDNFVSVDNCATRLRLVVKDNATFEDGPIKAAGAFGVKRLGTEGVQIVIGADVEHVADAVKKLTGK